MQFSVLSSPLLSSIFNITHHEESRRQIVALLVEVRSTGFLAGLLRTFPEVVFPGEGCRGRGQLAHADSGSVSIPHCSLYRALNRNQRLLTSAPEGLLFAL